MAKKEDVLSGAHAPGHKHGKDSNSWPLKIKNMKKDSLGNPLPKSVFLPTNATQEQILDAIAVNTFVLAASVSIENGKNVIYDAKNKNVVAF